jgi:L-rhamnose-H+ transport protein
MPLFAEAVTAAPNPALGVLIFALGGLAGAIFYLPFKKVKNWAWESYWLVYSVFALILVPWALALSVSPNAWSVIQSAPGREIGLCMLFGAMWGVGNLTWGLMIRYLGFGLGLAIGCGLCSAAGTLMPPLVKGDLGPLVATDAGVASLVGVVVSLIGIFLVGGAGMSKESELSEEAKKKAIAEYNFKLGLCAAIFSGLMSAGMNFGLQAGGKLEELATTIEPVTTETWRGIPVLVVVLLGGFIVNGGWSLLLNIKNRSMGDYVKSETPLAGNLFFAALAGAIWTSQFICLKSGEPAMGAMKYIGWSVMFSGVILFSTVLGIVLGEWRNTSGRTRLLLGLGLAFLVFSSVISGYSGYLNLKQ